MFSLNIKQLFKAPYYFSYYQKLFDRDRKNPNARRGWNKNQGARNKNNMQMKSRDASVTVRADWNTIEEMDFVRFSKLSLPNIKDPEDL